MPNYNILRRARLAPVFIAIAAGNIACDPVDLSEKPPAAVSNTVDPPPECNLIAEPDPAKPRTWDFRVETNGTADIPGKWRPDYVEYGFEGQGDTTEGGLSAEHTYARAGDYGVYAAIVMDIFDHTGSPFFDGELACPPIIVTVP